MCVTCCRRILAAEWFVMFLPLSVFVTSLCLTLLLTLHLDSGLTLVIVFTLMWAPAFLFYKFIKFCAYLIVRRHSMAKLRKLKQKQIIADADETTTGSSSSNNNAATTTMRNSAGTRAEIISAADIKSYSAAKQTCRSSSSSNAWRLFSSAGRRSSSSSATVLSPLGSPSSFAAPLPPPSPLDAINHHTASLLPVTSPPTPSSLPPTIGLFRSITSGISNIRGGEGDRCHQLSSQVYATEALHPASSTTRSHRHLQNNNNDPGGGDSPLLPMMMSMNNRHPRRHHHRLHQTSAENSNVDIDNDDDDDGRSLTIPTTAPARGNGPQGYGVVPQAQQQQQRPTTTQNTNNKNNDGNCSSRTAQSIQTEYASLNAVPYTLIGTFNEHSRINRELPLPIPSGSPIPAIRNYNMNNRLLTTSSSLSTTAKHNHNNNTNSPCSTDESNYSSQQTTAMAIADAAVEREAEEEEEEEAAGGEDLLINNPPNSFSVGIGIGNNFHSTNMNNMMQDNNDMDLDLLERAATTGEESTFFKPNQQHTITRI